MVRARARQRARHQRHTLVWYTGLRRHRRVLRAGCARAVCARVASRAGREYEELRTGQPMTRMRSAEYPTPVCVVRRTPVFDRFSLTCTCIVPK